MKIKKWSFFWALGITVFLVLVLIDSTPIGMEIAYRVHFSFFGFCLLVALLQLAFLGLAIGFVAHFKSISIRESLHFVGFKKPTANEILLGALLVVPMAVGSFLGYQYRFDRKIEIDLIPQWPVWLFTIITGAGIFEEVFFRGFIFQLLRQKRSFVAAATLSGILFSLYHLSNLDFDSTKFNFAEVFGDMLAAIILSYPSAYVFEKCGNKIWPWMLAHIAYDLFTLVKYQNGMDHFWWGHFFHPVGALVMVAITFPLTNWLLPDQKVKNSRVRKNRSKNKKLFSATVWSLAILLLMSESFFLLPVTFLWRDWLDIYQFEKRIEINPKDSDAYYEWGLCLFKLGDNSEAVDKFKKAIEINDKPLGPYEFLGLTYFILHKYKEAVETYEKVTDKTPKNNLFYIGWGDALSEDGRPQEAISKYQQALKLNPKDILAYIAWGKALDKLEKYSEAEDEFITVIKLDDNNPSAYSWLGFTYEKMGRHLEAIQQYKRAIVVNEDWPILKAEDEKTLSDLQKKYGV